MEYKWNIDELKLNIEVLKYIYSSINNKSIKRQINLFIIHYENMINIVNNNHNSALSFNTNYENMKLEDLIDDVIYNYNSMNLPYIDKLLQTFLIINEYTFHKQDIKIEITNDELVDTCIDFFKEMTLPSISSKLDEIIDNNKINITSLNCDLDYDGNTFIDYILKKKYIYINRQNELIDLVLLPHETFHYIFSNTNINDTFGKNSSFLLEVEGSFANILFSEYYDNNAIEFKNYFKNYHNHVLQSEIDDLVVRNTLIDALRSNKNIRFNKLNKCLNYYGIDSFNSEEELIPYLEVPEETHIRYALSTLVAIDLYYIYQKDKEKAFYLLENITYSRSRNDIFNLLRNNEITFMDDNYTNLKKYIKN